jgi:hypothetical protein
VRLRKLPFLLLHLPARLTDGPISLAGTGTLSSTMRGIQLHMH